MDDAATLRLTLVRSSDDDATFSPGYQAELSQFYQRVRADQIRVSAVAFTMDSAGGGGGLMGEFIVPLAQVIGPVLGGAAVAWLQGRAGRKLRVKVGDIEVEARTHEEIDQLLARAQTLQASQRGKTDEA